MTSNDNLQHFSDKEAEELVSSYLFNHSYSPKRFNKKEMRSGFKTTDFFVEENNEIKFYCEVKNPLLLVNEETQMFHWTTSISKIREFIRKANKQFKDVDKKHSKPWIIFFTSSHFQLNWSNFADAYLGYVARNGKMINDLRKERYVYEYNVDVNSIDAYIWLQINNKKKTIYQLVQFVNYDSILKNETELIMNKLVPFASENIMDKNSKNYGSTKVNK